MLIMQEAFLSSTLVFV